MNTVRRSSIAMLLTAFALVLGIIVPSGALADEATGWPLHMVTGMTPTSMAAFGNDSLSFANCSNSAQANSFQYVYEGITASTLPTADSNGNGVSCGSNGALFAPDGTFYTTNVVNTWNHQALTFVAMKNGRTLWSQDLSTNANDPVCGSMSSWGLDQYNVRMTGASIGSDGNIYGLVQPINPHCPMYLTKVNGSDGTVVYKMPINTDQSGLPGDRLWVYGDKLLVLAANGSLRQFNYDGTENTSAAYQFPMSTIGTITGAYANADGRVFVTGTGSGSDTVIGYADLNGANGTVNSGLGVNPQVHFMPGTGGSFVAADQYGSVTTYHIASTGITTTSASALPSSADHAITTNYWQDQSGNAVMVRQLFDSNWASTGVTVDEIDGTTGAVTNLLLVGVDSTHPSPTLKTVDISPDGYLYAVICHDNSACGNTSGSSLDGWVHKVQTTGFGSPIKDANSFTTYTPVTSKLNYVAMGDSFSSGEGNSPYLNGTDTADDTCHRSPVAYPELLENTTTLNLNMTGFAACSGAITDDILGNNVPNGEVPQGDFLRPDTNLVTMTMGGNDVGFRTVLTTCLEQSESNCLSAGQTFINQANSTTQQDKWTSSYASIRQLVNGQTKIYIVGYPDVFPTSGQVQGTCTWGDGVSPTTGDPITTTELDDFAQWATKLNQDLNEAVTAANDPNLHFIDPSSTFAGHGICTSDPWFNNVVEHVDPIDQSGSYHPNAQGQQEYAAVIADYLTSH